MNPFFKPQHENYSNFVAEQLTTMRVGDSIRANLGNKQKSDFRMCIGFISKKLDMKFKTKSSTDGAMWVKRIS